jgi:hypothetical protein
MIWMKILVWIAFKKLGFEYMDVYAPGSEVDDDAEIVGITFTTDVHFVNAVSEIEL